MRRSPHGRSYPNTSERSIGRKRAQLLVETAQFSVGVDYGVDAAHCKLRLLLESLELVNRQLSSIEEEMASVLQKTGISDYLLSIRGVTLSPWRYVWVNWATRCDLIGFLFHSQFAQYQLLLICQALTMWMGF